MFAYMYWVITFDELATRVQISFKINYNYIIIM